jgi:hypothetical protein
VTEIALSEHVTATHRAFSFRRIGAIASNTLLELVRLKVFYFLLIFALLIIGSSVFMVRFTFQEQFQVLKDVALGAMSIFSWLLAVLATAMLLPKDLEDRTLYTILAKPVPRYEYLLGKLAGVLLLLLIAILLMSAVFAAALYFQQQTVIAQMAHQAGHLPQQQVDEVVRSIRATTFTSSLIAAIVAIYLKAALFAALTLFISTFATSWIFTIIVSVVIYFIGHIQSVAREYWMSEGLTTTKSVFLAVVALLFPDLQLFNLVDDIVAGNRIPLDLFGKTAALGVVYICVYTLAAYIVFARKEL